MKTVTLHQGLTRTSTVHGGVAGDFDRIPVIDLAALIDPLASDDDKARLVSEVRDACTRVGFFIIKNHGIDWKIVEEAFEALEEFFSLPLEEKMKIHQHASPSFMGYEQMYYTNVDGTKKGDKKEGVSVAYNPDIDPQGVNKHSTPELLRRENLWPASGVSPKFRPGVEAYQMACLGLTRKLICILALAMGEEPSYFDTKTTYPIASVRCLHYPPQEPIEDNETGLGAHTDIQLMALIAQKPHGQQALEVLNKAGDWIRPELPEPGCFVVNLSDMTSRLTNDVFQSTIHQVKNNSDSARDRYSLPFFFGLNQDELTSTLPQFVIADSPLKEAYVNGMTGYEHYNRRIRKAHDKHPDAQGNLANGLPAGMTRADGVLVDGL